MDTAAWQKSLGWDESAARRSQLITGSVGLVILFIGVVMQWWAGNNISDISLSTFCESYSGEPDVTDSIDWKQMKAAYYNANNPNRQGDLSLAKMANQFFGGDGTVGDVDRAIYNDPSFWCKYLPECPAGATCTENQAGILMLRDVGTAKGNGLWNGRRISQKKHWNLAPGAFSLASTHIRCWDKFTVYREMIDEVMVEQPTSSSASAPKIYVTDPVSGARWNEDSIDTASYAQLFTCYGSKGSTGYILGLGPLLSSMASLFCVVSLFTCCPTSYSSTLGRGLALMAFAFTLIGFWVVSFTSIREFVADYMYCGSSTTPLTNNRGMYFDGTPCLDRNSDGENEMNPFLSWSAWMTGVYTFGGAFNIIATVILLVTIAKTIAGDQLKKFATLTPSDEL